MPYPATISNTSTYPRAKNAVIGAFLTANARRPVNEQLVYIVSQFLNVGSSAVNAGQAASFTAPRNYQVGVISVPICRNASPTDDFVLSVRTDDGNGLPSSTVLGSVSLPGPSFLTVGALAYMYDFDFTSQNINLDGGTRYHVVATRSGAVGPNYYKWAMQNTNISAETYVSTFRSDLGTWSLGLATNDLPFLICEANIAQFGAVVFLANETTDRLEGWVSYDQGLTWAVRDLTHSRFLVAGDNTRRSYEATSETTDVAHVALISGPTAGDAGYFDLKQMAWRNVEIVASGANSISVSGTVPWFSEVRTADSVKIYTFQGATELVASVARRRIKLHRLGGGTTLDIITGTTGLPATAVDYDLRFMIEGDSSDTLIFWTQSDTTAIQFRRYKSDNTFGPITSLTNTTIDNAAFYPIGYGTVYTNVNKYISLPYYDTAVGGVCVLDCRANVDLDTAGNWTRSTAILMVAETNLSNPCVAGTDGGKKRWVWANDDTTRKLWYTNDGGTGTWVAPIEWKPTQTYSVAAFCARVLTDRITLVYLDDSGTPRVKYDQLFF